MAVDIDTSLSNLSQTLKRRHELDQLALRELKGFNGQPRSIEIPPNYNVGDSAHTKGVLEAAGFRVELKFVSNSRPYFRIFAN